MSYKISREILLKAPREKVWKTYRDYLPELAKTMKTVDKIEVVKREKVENGFRIKNKWKISGGLPNSIQKIAPARLLSYYDNAFWDESRWVCDFVEKPIDDNGVYKCVGQNIFEEIDNNTRLIISFELIIYPEKIPAVPGFLKRGLVAKIEKIISKEVVKNLASTAKHVEEFIHTKE